MTAIIDGTNGLTTPNVLTSSSGVALTLQSGGTNGVIIDTSQNLQFNSGFGSVATGFGCRSWIYVSTPSSGTIGGSGNVSSLTRASAGQYTINFTNAMPDANYAVLLGYQNSAWGQFLITNVPKTTTAITIGAGTTATNQDPTSFCVAIVR